MTSIRRFFNRRYLFEAIGLVVLLVQLVVWLPNQLTNDGAVDLNAYHRAAQHLVSGQPVYGDAPRAQLDHAPSEFFYPPTALVLFKPFAHASTNAFRAVFYPVVLVAFWALAAGLARIVTCRHDKLRVSGVLIAGFVLQFVPGITHMMGMGNLDIVVFALVAWAFAAPRWTAMLLVLGAALKLYPAVLLVVWWSSSQHFRRQALLTASTVLSVSLLILGPGIFVEWGTVGMHALSGGTFSSWNWSLSTLLVRPFVHDMSAPLPSAVHHTLIWFPWAAVLLVAITQRHRGPLMQGALVLVATVWAAPICWWWRLTLALVFPLVIWIRKRKELSCATQ